MYIAIASETMSEEEITPGHGLAFYIGADFYL
jgi:hypothetical protein